MTNPQKRRYKFGRNDAIAKAVDGIETAAEKEIEAAYSRAYIGAMRENRVVMRKLRDLLNCKTKPPSWCVTQVQKNRWLEKQYKALTIDLDLKITLQEMKAGAKAVQIIQRTSERVYQTAYDETIKSLER